MKTKAERVLECVERFIKDNEITCGEDVYDMDHVIENAYEFIDELCTIAGYHVRSDEDEIEMKETNPESNGHYLGLDRETW